MTTTLSAKGQIVIPQSVRSQLSLRPGDPFAVLTSRSGDILLKPLGKRPTAGWLRSLKRLKGLETARQHEPVRDIRL
jgi:AbrB family looped-hinge helix DNA binding protein